MKAYVTFTRKGLLALFAVIAVILLICVETYSVESRNKTVDAKTNADRIAFIKNSGYTLLSKEPQTKSVTIPESFSDVYSNYNNIQRQSGYDLSEYKGCEVTIYTYSIKAPSGYEGECVLNMIVYNGNCIGGDVSSAALGGFILSIKKSE